MSGQAKAPGLAATQDAMRAAMHEGTPEALLALTTLVAPHPGASDDHGPREQIEVYRTMYWARQAEALGDDFPAVRRLVGEALFDRVSVTHVKRHPSRHASLAFLGREFTETLTHLGLTTEAEVARLEWARVEAFWAPHAEPATAALLGSLGEGLAEAVLSMHPSLRLLALPDYVRACVAGVAGEGTSPIAPSTGEAPREHVVVWRRGNAVVEAVIGETEARALGRAIEGEPVALICEAFVEAEAPDDEAIQALVRWVTAGWVAGAAGVVDR